MSITILELDPEPRRDLVARLAVFHAVRQHLLNFREVASRTLQGQKALTDLLVAAHSLPSALEDDATGVDWLAQYWTKSLQLTLAFPARDDRCPVQTKMVLKSLLKALPPSPEEPDPLGKLFARVCQETSKVYRDVSLQPRLWVAEVWNHPGLGNDPYGVTAKTVRTNDPVEVQLSFCLREFGPETYAVLPMVMVHECVCHVYSGHAGDSNDSSFAEGMMDWAAQFFFARWILKIDESMEPAAKYYTSDFTRLLPGRSPDGGYRESGLGAARNLSSWMRGLGGLTDGESQRRVAQLAVELNASKRDLVEKDVLVEQLYEGFQGFPRLLDRALRAWARGEAAADAILDAALESGA